MSQLSTLSVEETMKKKKCCKIDSLAKSLPKNSKPAIIFGSCHKKRYFWLCLSPNTSLTAKYFNTSQQYASYVSQTDCRAGGCGGEAGK